MFENHSRRRFIHLASLGLAGLPLALSAYSAFGATKKRKEYMVYVGTYAKPDADSIFGYNLNPESGELTRAFGMKGGENPTFLTVDGERKFLYSVNEISSFRGVKSGSVSAFTINPKTGGLTFLNQEASVGTGPCYITPDKTGKLLFVANYGGGSVTVLPIRATSMVGTASDTRQHTGSSANTKRQAGPHAHCIIPDPDNKFVLAVDLGIDKVLSYKLDLSQGKLILQNQPAFTARPGAGPRHLTFHPNKKHAYLINELNSTMTALTYNQETGIFSELQTISTLPADFTGESFCADVHVSPNGKFLYGSNRGHNSLVVFAIDKKTGRLTLVQHVATGGEWPRNFAIDPSGRILLVANQNTNNIVTFHIDKETGKLASTGVNIKVPAPVCLQIVPAFS